MLDRNLSDRRWLCGDDYTIADMATAPWYGALSLGLLYGGGEFLEVESYTNVRRWTNEFVERPAVQRGQRVNKPWGPEEEQCAERHSASDLDIG